MNSTKEINEYLKRLKNGDKCLDEFYKAVSGYIKFIAYNYLVDKSYVSDVVINTFYKVLDNIQIFDESRSGKAWISKIAQNEAYSINSRERKHGYVPIDEVSEEIACTSNDSQALEFVADLQKALSKLDEADRTIVEQRIFYGATFEQIAEALGICVGTAHKRFKRSVKKIINDIL